MRTFYAICKRERTMSTRFGSVGSGSVPVGPWALTTEPAAGAWLEDARAAVENNDRRLAPSTRLRAILFDMEFSFERRVALKRKLQNIAHFSERPLNAVTQASRETR
jgi:hypothetical protein